MHKSRLNVKIKKLIRKLCPFVQKSSNTLAGPSSKCLESGHVFALLCLETIFLFLFYIMGQADKRTGLTPPNLIFKEFKT